MTEHPPSTALQLANHLDVQLLPVVRPAPAGGKRHPIRQSGFRAGLHVKVALPSGDECEVVVEL